MKILNLMILATLFKENKYGLQIIKDIKNISKMEIDLKLPSLYNSIKRMEGYGYLESYWENSEIGGKRRYCSLTEKGRSHLLSQMDILSEEDRTLIKNLMDNVQSINLNKNFEQKVELQQSPIAIQPNFLSQCYENNEQDSSSLSQDNVNNGKVESYEQFSIIDNKNDNHEHKQSFDFKDIFGDIVYENNVQKSIDEKNLISNDNQNISPSNQEQKMQKNLESISNDIPKISEEEGLITDKQILDENYKINITLKTENSINKEKQLDIGKSKNLLFGTVPKEDTSEPIQKQLDTKQKESNIMSKCLKNFDKIGITYSLYNELPMIKTKERKPYENSKKFYKNKFRLMQFSITSIISSLILLCVYIVLDITSEISPLQTTLYIVFWGCIIALFCVYLFKLIKEPNQLYEYKKLKMKNLINLVYANCILILIIIAICFLCGMTFSTLKNYLTFIIMPVLFIGVIFLDYLIGIIMTKNNKYFIKD